MKDADLIVFDANDKSVRRIDLGADSDPFDIELWRDRAIVSDATNYRVDAITLDGKRVAAFDDAAFDAELAKARDAPRIWHEVRFAAQIGVVAIPVLAIILLSFMGAPMGIKLEMSAPRVSRENSTRLSGNVRWVAVSSAYPELARAGVKKLAWIQAIAMPGIVAITVLTFGPGVFHDPKFQTILWMIGALIVLFILIIPFSVRNAGKQYEGYRIGASASGLHYELPRFMAPFGMNREGRSDWQDVYYDGRRLLAEQKVLMLKTPQGVPLFEEEELRSVILANVPPSNVVSPDKLMLKQLSSPWAWLVIAVLVAVMAWQLARTFV
jgi:hypothetical protein